MRPARSAPGATFVSGHCAEPERRTSGYRATIFGRFRTLHVEKILLSSRFTDRAALADLARVCDAAPADAFAPAIAHIKHGGTAGYRFKEAPSRSSAKPREHIASACSLSCTDETWQVDTCSCATHLRDFRYWGQQSLARI
jgi:hypothetical protein